MPGERNEPVRRAAEVGASRSTVEAGERHPKDPVEGRGCLHRGTVGGKHGECIETRHRVHETTTDSTGGESTKDEPYALMGQVRICGSRGERSPRRPGGGTLTCPPTFISCSQVEIHETIQGATILGCGMVRAGQRDRRFGCALEKCNTGESKTSLDFDVESLECCS